MALKATIFKIELAIADMSRHYYQTHMLTLAQHPSETTERMMVRLIAFALCAHERLLFGKGISEDAEPDLWQHDYSGNIELWIELGFPEEKLLRRACHRAAQGMVVAYGGSIVDKWWQTQQKAALALENLTVVAIRSEQSSALAQMAQRTMQLQCTIQEGQLLFASADQSVVVEPRLLKAAKQPLFTLE